MYYPLWNCHVLGPVVLVAGIYEGVASCMFVGLECVGYLVYDRLYKGILCVGECMWRVGVATSHGLGKVCSRGWGVLVAKICLFCGSHVLGISKFEELCNLCI